MRFLFRYAGVFALVITVITVIREPAASAAAVNNAIVQASGAGSHVANFFANLDLS